MIGRARSLDAHAIDNPMVLPAWRRIEAALISEITSRKLEPGSRLPAEGLIAERFGVSRMTARKALSSLQHQGYIRIEAGRGTFVQDTIFPYSLGRDSRFCHYLSSAKVEPSRRLVERCRIEANVRVARELHLDEGAPTTLIRVLGSADGNPVLLANHYMPVARFPGIDDTYARVGSLTDALRLYGVHRRKRARIELISRMPSVEEAALLQQPRTRPVTELEITYVDEAGEPVVYDTTCFAGDRVRFVLDEN